MGKPSPFGSTGLVQPRFEAGLRRACAWHQTLSVVGCLGKAACPSLRQFLLWHAGLHR